jgi:hypothetical protein
MAKHLTEGLRTGARRDMAGMAVTTSRAVGAITRAGTAQVEAGTAQVEAGTLGDMDAIE